MIGTYKHSPADIAILKCEKRVRNSKGIIALILMSSLLSFQVIAQNDTQSIVDSVQKMYTGQKLSLLFPVNIINTNVRLSVNVPEGFQLLKNPPGTKIMEFIPATDKDPYVWSEILTIMPIIGKQISADAIVQSILAQMKQGTKGLKVLDEHKIKQDKYIENYVDIVYSTESRQEVLRIYAISGPYDSVMVQYAMPAKSDADIKIALQKIKQFYEKNTTLIK